MKRLATFSLILLLSIATACTNEANVSADVVAQVNGVSITADALEVEFVRAVIGAEVPPGEEDILDIKLQLLSDMISNQILLQIAADYELTATDAEVEVRYNEFKNQYTEERFAELLAEQQATVEDVREDMRSGLTVEKLINMEITSKVTVSEAEIEEFYDANVERFDLQESFFVAHILVTPTEDETITNSTGDDATTQQEAAEKALRLLGDVKGGLDFAIMAREYSEDPSTATTGGELGFQTLEALAGVDPAVADAVRQMRIGETYPNVVASQFGLHILKLIDRDEGGQKDLSDPEIVAQIRQAIFDQRDRILRAAYFETVRNQAVVRNFFAQRILEGTEP